MNRRLPVIAAIPNYNMAESLSKLLPQILEQGYDAVYVLDDASTDDSRHVVARFGPAVAWVGGTVNFGAGGNRNRILQAHSNECIIHFIDADTRLETTDVPTKARRLLEKPGIAFVGGLVRDTHGRQLLWNYGPNSVSLYALLTAAVQTFFGAVQAPNPWWRRVIRTLTRPLCREWPDIAMPPQRRAVYWPIEGNMLIKRSVLEQLGGFDGSVREYDIIPPARKAYELGLVSYFDPTIAVTHLRINVRYYNRPLLLYKELFRFIKQYGGWRAWILPDGRFKPAYNERPMEKSRISRYNKEHYGQEEAEHAEGYPKPPRPVRLRTRG